MMSVEGLHAPVAGSRPCLAEHQHKREDVLVRVVKPDVGVLLHVANGNVQQVSPVSRHGNAHFLQELLEALGRDEVFVQDLRSLRFALRYSLASSFRSWLREKTRPAIFRASRISRSQRSLPAAADFRKQYRSPQGSEAGLFKAGIGPRRRPKQRYHGIAQKHLGVGVHVEPANRHRDVAVLLYPRPEAADIVACGNEERRLGDVSGVGDDAQIDVENDPEQPIAAQRQAEQLGIVVAAATHDLTVRLQQTEGFDRRGDGRPVVLPAVTVDADRAADAEIVGRLHDRHGQAASVEIGDNVRPAPRNQRAGGGGRQAACP